MIKLTRVYDKLINNEYVITSVSIFLAICCINMLTILTVP